jgi:hypothetical protein
LQFRAHAQVLKRKQNDALTLASRRSKPRWIR